MIIPGMFVRLQRSPSLALGVTMFSNMMGYLEQDVTGHMKAKDLAIVLAVPAMTYSSNHEHKLRYVSTLHAEVYIMLYGVDVCCGWVSASSLEQI